MIKLRGSIQTPILIVVIISFFIASVIIISHRPEKIEQKSGIQGKTRAEINWQWTDNQKKLYELDSREINSIFQELRERFAEEGERLKALATLRLGTPYQIGCLGEESGRDKDPLFRLDVTDCTAFILTNIALLHSKDLGEAQEMMKSLNYRTNRDITFENRLHFTIDRNMTSPYFRNITEEIAGTDRVIEINLVLNKIKEDGSRLIDIPNKYITKNLIDKLPKSVGIAFIRKEDARIGLDVAHEGFLFDNQLFLHASVGIAFIRKEDARIGLDVAHEGFLFDNQLFLHASSIEKKVVAINFWDYYFTEDNYTPRFDGIIFFEIK